MHPDPTASHYLKLMLDGVFCPRDGDFRNEIVWAYESGGRSKKDFGNKHDIIFRYSKSKQWIFNSQNILLPREGTRHNHMKKDVDSDGRVFWSIKSAGKIYKYYADEGVIPTDVWSNFSHLQQKDPERLGYPTQKPEALLERIIQASSNEGDTVLDAYCGCGTTVAVAQRLRRNWIGIDITYQSIAVILKRLEDSFGADIINTVTLDGIPRDMESAYALANKKDDRVRKEFEKWALLTYSKNRATINEKKGADKGIDGIAYIITSSDTTARVIFQVKSGKVKRNDIATLNSDRQREDAVMAILITLEESTKPMRDEALAVGTYHHELLNRDYPIIQIVTIQEMIEENKRIDLPLNIAVLKAAKAVIKDEQKGLL